MQPESCLAAVAALFPASGIGAQHAGEKNREVMVTPAGIKV